MPRQTPTSGLAPQRRPPTRSTLAVDSLRSEHRRLGTQLRQFARSPTDDDRAAMAEKICHGLIVYMMAEEEIFYPAFLASTDDQELYCQALVEHDAMKQLVTQILDAPMHGQLFLARMHLLAAMLQHHAEESERPDGMLAEATCAGLDCEELGERLRQQRDLLRKRMPLLRWRMPPRRTAAAQRDGMT